MTKPRSAARFLWAYIWAHPSFTMQALFSIVLMAVVNLPLPLLNKVVIDAVIPAGEVQPLILLGVFAFAVRAVASAFQVFQNFVVRSLMAGVGHDLRRAMMAAFLGAPYSAHTSGKISEQVSRLASDVTTVEMMILDTVRFLVRPICMLGMMVGVMLLVNVPATLIVLLATPLSVFASRHLRHQLRDLQEQVLVQRQGLVAHVSGALDAIRVIRVFGHEEQCRQKIAEKIQNYSEVTVEHATQTRILQAIIDVVTLIPWLALVVGGSVLIQSGELSIGEFMLFISIEQLLHSPLGQFAHHLLKVRTEMVATERVQEVVEMELEPSEQGPRGVALGGEVVFDHVDFEYVPGRPVIKQLCLRLAAGERVAVVGPSGAGKSTLIQLLLGFYPPTKGSIAFDGRSFADLHLRELRQQIGVVFQDNPMFDASIEQNLRLDHEELDEEALWQALEQAEAADFVRSLPDQLHTHIGVKGLKLSGGQRQRLAIARVILRNPSLVILDEATSSLDSVTEQQIKRALDRLLKNRTSLTIAHRLSTIVGSDRILFLDQGIIQEQGSHHELLAIPGGRYRDLVDAQFGADS